MKSIHTALSVVMTIMLQLTVYRDRKRRNRRDSGEEFDITIGVHQKIRECTRQNWNKNLPKENSIRGISFNNLIYNFIQ
jgi:hypothetical protein